MVIILLVFASKSLIMCEIIVITVVVVLTMLMIACYIRGFSNGKKLGETKQNYATLLGNPQSRLDARLAHASENFEGYLADQDDGVPYGADTAAAQAQMSLPTPMMCGMTKGDRSCIKWNTSPSNWVITSQPSVLWQPGLFVKPI